jgi:hypothetical protein
LSHDRTKNWPRRLVAMWARQKATDLRRWERKVRKAYSEGTSLGEACGVYAVALLECAEVMERCAASLMEEP